jgi:hypothetical protein
MQAKSTIMLTGPSHVIILSSQRRANGVDTPLPLAPPVAWETIASLGIFSIVGVLIYARISHRKQHSSRVRLPLMITCSRCQYFDNNQYLKCALHPAIGMTEQAVDCNDYCPKAEAKQAEKLKRILLTIQKVFS